MVAALIIGGVSYYLYQRQSTTETKNPKTRDVAGDKEGTDQEETETPETTMPQPNLEEDQVAVYFVDIGNKRNVEETFGCDDSLSYLERQLEGTEQTTAGKIKTAVTFMVEGTDRLVGKGGLYNVFYNSDLTVDRVEIEESTAKVYLTGELALAGTCDNPRVDAQLTETITQFEEVESAEIYLNEEPLDLSLK